MNILLVGIGGKVRTPKGVQTKKDLMLQGCSINERTPLRICLLWFLSDKSGSFEDPL